MFTVPVICRRFLYTTALLALLASSAAAQQPQQAELYGSGVGRQGRSDLFPCPPAVCDGRRHRA